MHPAADEASGGGGGDRAAAVERIRHRDAVGAVILDPASPEVLTASAAGAGPNQLMGQLTTTLQQRLAAQAATAHQPPPQLRITDVAPYGAEDRTGTRLSLAALPLLVGGILGGALLSTAVAGRRRQLLGLASFAVIAGFGLGAILQFWYGALTGDYLAAVGVITLAAFTMASVVVGLRRLLGTPGIAVAAVIFILGGNAISGASVPTEFLPEPWATIGQGLPQGAAATLLRDVSYFPDASTAAGWLTLACWAPSAWC